MRTKKLNGAQAPTKAPAKAPPKPGALTALNDSIKRTFSAQMAGAKAEAPAPVKAGAPAPAAIPMMALPAPADVKPTKAEALGELETLTVSVLELKAALLIAAKDEVRKALVGVCLRERDGRIELAASNGHCLLVQRLGTFGKDSPAWLKGGIVIARERLTALCKMGDGDVTLKFGKGHPHVLAEVGFATFKLLTEDSPFPAYENIIASNSDALAGGDGLPLTAVCLAPEYVKAASAVAKAFESEELHCFPSHGSKGAAMITFGQQISAMLYVMAKSGGEAMPSTVLQMIGPGLRGTVAALRAHITRSVQAEKGATKEEKVRLGAKREGLEKRLAAVIASAGKAIEHRPAGSAMRPQPRDFPDDYDDDEE